MNMKKLASLLLALVMLMSVCSGAMASETPTTDLENMKGDLGGGSITINDAIAGQTYSLYQILYLESYNAETGAYAYKVSDPWNDFVVNGAGKDYLAVDAQGYVTWIGDDTAAATAAFAAFAKAYAATKGILPVMQVKASTNEVKFVDLKLGYYLIDSTLGTLCSLDTTKPNAIMQEKNEAPTVTKEVQEDSDNSWGESNDADINQTVKFTATITVQEGAENYILHDTMSAGLTYVDVESVMIKNGDAVAAGNYTVTSPGTCGCTFEVKFDNEYIATLTADTQIVVVYTAVLNENAVVGADGNTNEVKLQYGDENKPSYTPVDTTITYTWDMEVVKYTLNQDGVEVALKDATFKLSYDDKGINVLKFHDLGENKYEVCADTACTKKHVTEITTTETGTFSIEGLDAGTYYLTETAAPDGYNKLSGPVTVVIDKNGDVKVGDATVTQIKVENKTGSELPSTGGMGTTILYAAGGILLVGALVLMLTKKRASAK